MVRNGGVTVKGLGFGAGVLALLAGAARAQVVQPAEPAAEVEEVIVTGRAQRLYRAGETTVGRAAADPLDIPQAVTVINEQLYKDQGARDVTDLYRNIAGVSFFSYSGVTFRGFRQDEVFYDNLRGNPFIGFSVPQLFNIERVEVLKGPAGMLYGPGAPGGLINYVTKTPEAEVSAEATAVVGDYARRGGSLEVTGPLDPQGRLLGRVGGFYEYMEPFRFNTNDETVILDAGLTVRPSEAVELILQATRYGQRLNANRLRGVPVDDEGRFLTDVRWNHNEPTDFLDLEADVVQARLVARPAPGVRIDAALRGFGSQERQQYHEPRGLLDTDDDGRLDTSLREFRDQARETDGVAAAVNLAAERRLLGLEHTLLAGGDWYREESSFFGRTARDASRRGPVPSLSLQNPVYGLTSGANYNLAAITPSLSESRTLRWGVYLQDQIALTPQWLIVGGVRRDAFEDENLRNGQRFEEAELTYRAGAVYKPRPDLSLYAGWSQGFEPHDIGAQDPLAGGPFDPVSGEQVEAGVKAALFGGRLQGQAAVFEIKRRNLLQLDPDGDDSDGVDDLAPIGEVTSTGFEVELAADLTPDWVVTANYAFNDARITGTAAGQTLDNAVGDRFANAPEHQAGLWTRYQVDAIGAAFALGAEYVGERLSLDGQKVRPYAVFDASIIKSFGGRYEALLRIDNLLDEDYAASGFIRRTGHFPGEPRTVFLELRARFP